MSADLSSYRSDLILALRLRDIPGDRIGEIVAEVESHVADTGEEPREAFGTAAEYAASFTGQERVNWGWADALLALGAALGGWLIADGLLGLVSDPMTPLPAWALLVAGVVLALPVLRHVRRSASTVRDPRTGEDMVPLPRGAPWALAGSLALPLVVAAGVIVAFS